MDAEPAAEESTAIEPTTADPTSKIAEDFAAIKEQWQSELDKANEQVKASNAKLDDTIFSSGKVIESLRVKLSDLRPVPNPVMPDGSPLSEDALTQSNQIHALAAQEINRLRQLDQPGKHLTLADLLDGPLHP